MNVDVVALGKTLGKQADARLMYGSQRINLTGTWQAIESLSAQEVMTHYRVNPNADIEIQYSKRDNQYYIRSKEGPQEVKFDFLLQIPHSKVSLPSEYQDIVHRFNTEFRAGSLKHDKANPSGEDYLRYIQTQQKGACRHRTVAFKDLMQKEHPEISVRMITNGCHAFVEIKIGDEWVICDLGGYPAKLNVNDKNNPHKAPNAPSMIQIIDHPDSESELAFMEALKTWEKEEVKPASLLHYCQQLIAPDEARKCLIEVSGQDALKGLHLALQAYCKHISRPFFYVDSPKDLMCSASYMEREGDKGILCEGPGGPLYDFLKMPYDPSNPPVLIVNYANFDPDDLVRFNGLLDDIRQADGTLLPEFLRQTSVIDTDKPDCAPGSDFYSRLDKVEKNPISKQELMDACPKIPVSEKPVPAPKSHVINLFHAFNWKDRLLGHWVIHKDNLYFEQGALAEALASGLPIELQNAPWQDEAFVLFWQQAMVNKGVTYAKRSLDFPAELRLLKSEGYDWQSLRQNLRFTDREQVGAEVLNPTRLSQFFHQYECDNASKTLDTIDGFVKNQAKGVPLRVNLTRNLSEDEWAMLLSCCQEHQVSLVCHAPPEVLSALPDFLEPKTLSLGTADKLPDNNLDSKTKVILSSDVDTTVKQLTNGELDWEIIDVSECEAADLLIKIDGKVDKSDKQRPRLEFSQSTKAVLNALYGDKALPGDKKVLLKGHFSDALADSIAPLLQTRRENATTTKGTLVLVGDLNAPLAYAKLRLHRVTVAEKKACLSPQDLSSLTEQQFINEPLSTLQTRLDFQQQHPNEASDNAWRGLYSLPFPSGNLPEFDAEHSAEISQAFINTRVEGLQTHFKLNPYAFVTGLTATGKSTFIEKYFDNDDYKLYKNETMMEKWALDHKPNQVKLLFIDEANLSPSQWSQFEGLFNSPPGMLINGVYYPLDEQHKVVFAGNPLNTGGERNLADFFKRHGGALPFDIMPQEFIYEEILKPVFANTTIEKNTLAITRPMLEVYRFLVQYSKDEVLISARELQMMALLVAVYQQHNPNADLNAVAKFYAYSLAKNLVPDAQKANFESCFACVLPEPLECNQPKDFLLTPSREAAHQQLNEFISLRKFRQREDNNDAQKYGGLGGFILESAPGLGKSLQVLATLRARGLQETSLDNAERVANGYYYMPVSMQLDKKERLLLRAFDEGAVVVIDEINSSPMMERLLNDLLMGKTPEGKRPTHPGFLVIGTQNPVTMPGRRAPTNALARRSLKTNIDPYPPKEMRSILVSMGVETKVARSMVNSLVKNMAKANREHLTPAPNFRNLCRLAKRYVLAKKEEKEEQLDKENISPNLAIPKTEKAKLSDSLVERFETICSEYPADDLAKARALLIDYLQNTRSKTFFNSNALQIDKVLELIDEEKSIKTVEDLTAQIQKLSLAKDEPLERCIQYIQNNRGTFEKEEQVKISLDRSGMVK